MIRHFKHSEIDLQKWDECIAQSTYGLVYALSWYLDIVSPEWEALVEDDYKAVMPLTWKKKFGVRYLRQPFFSQKLGAFSRDEMSDKRLGEFMSKAQSLFSFAEINLNASNDLADARRHDNFELSLAKGYEQLAASYHENTRRNLLRALKNNLEIVADVDVEKVISLFDSDRRQSLDSFDDSSYSVLRCLVEEAIRRGNGFVRGVASGGTNDVVTAAVFLNYGNKITFVFSGNSIEGKNMQAMTFLVDSVIKQYSDTEFLLDFEGSDNEGLARFYRGFGSESVKYSSLYFNNMSWFSNCMLSLWKGLRHLSV